MSFFSSETTCCRPAFILSASAMSSADSNLGPCHGRFLSSILELQDCRIAGLPELKTPACNRSAFALTFPPSFFFAPFHPQKALLPPILTCGQCVIRK
jgi:hypothetical protein